MRQQPKRTKYRKQMKMPIRGVDVDSNLGRGVLKFGSMGLQSRERARLTARQIEATRRVRRYYLKRTGKVWIRCFPDVPVTAKPLEVRMGKGKGGVDYWACKVRGGMVLFEVDGVDEERCREAIVMASKKLPMKTRRVVRDEVRGEEERSKRSGVDPASDELDLPSLVK
jgi:large subunit ribosomal protein L16